MSNTGSLTEAEKDACVCLSTLFLDCEMTSDDIALMAQSLHRLGIPVDQLDHILRYEVFPILYPHLLNPAGIWDYFAEADLITRVNGLRTHQQKVLLMLGGNMAWMILGGSVLTSRAPVKEMLRQLDQGTSSERSSALVEFFFSQRFPILSLSLYLLSYKPLTPWNSNTTLTNAET
ncbi:hypothetical protein BDV24DRAFT_169532 [Aspergillus arachidicola]|uniref:DUF7079 domain-containing protein n=1 Tax=Aspergillus arachidicola TaxID=656916 RepID=A0A5N6XU58_9EURO|nr:hypothetical protein BDV24DRAFT_169532 [Aspergillus arachidicola]